MIGRRATGWSADETALGALDVQGVTVRFGGLTALSDVSLEASPGRVVGIIGPNGAGKTTLFNAICGFIRPDAGTISWQGRGLNGVKPHDLARLGIARTLQGVGLFAHLTATDNVAVGADHRHRSGFWAALLGLPRSDRADGEVRAAALAALEAVGIAETADRTASELAYAMQKRVGLARALVAQPRLLLLDEPAGGLGTDDVEGLTRLIDGLRGEMTVMLVEHHMDFVMSVCDEVVVLDSGQVVARGSPSEVQTDRNVLEAYLGATAAAHPSGSSPEEGASA